MFKMSKFSPYLYLYLYISSLKSKEMSLFMTQLVTLDDNK